MAGSYGFIQGRGPGSRFLDFSVPGINVFSKHLFAGCLKWRCWKILQQPSWDPWPGDLGFEVPAGRSGLTMVGLQLKLQHTHFFGEFEQVLQNLSAGLVLTMMSLDRISRFCVNEDG